MFCGGSPPHLNVPRFNSAHSCGISISKCQTNTKLNFFITTSFRFAQTHHIRWQTYMYCTHKHTRIAPTQLSEWWWNQIRRLHAKLLLSISVGIFCMLTIALKYDCIIYGDGCKVKNHCIHVNHTTSPPHNSHNRHVFIHIYIYIIATFTLTAVSVCQHQRFHRTSCAASNANFHAHTFPPVPESGPRTNKPNNTQLHLHHGCWLVVWRARGN